MFLIHDATLNDATLIHDALAGLSVNTDFTRLYPDEPSVANMYVQSLFTPITYLISLTKLEVVPVELWRSLKQKNVGHRFPH